MFQKRPADHRRALELAQEFARSGRYANWQELVQDLRKHGVDDLDQALGADALRIRLEFETLRLP